MSNKVGWKHEMYLVAAAGTYPPVVATVAAGSKLGIAKDVDLESDADMIEASQRDGAGVKNFEYGLSNWTASAKALYVPTDTALGLLRSAHFNKTKVDCVFRESSTTGGENYVGVALVKKFKVGEPLNGEVVYEIELQGDGALVRATNA